MYNAVPCNALTATGLRTQQPRKLRSHASCSIPHAQRQVPLSLRLRGLAIPGSLLNCWDHTCGLALQHLGSLHPLPRYCTRVRTSHRATRTYIPLDTPCCVACRTVLYRAVLYRIKFQYVLASELHGTAVQLDVDKQRISSHPCRKATHGHHPKGCLANQGPTRPLKPRPNKPHAGDSHHRNPHRCGSTPAGDKLGAAHRK
eukprot:365319-Chlamydomonas_euryale.AAC.15